MLFSNSPRVHRWRSPGFLFGLAVALAGLICRASGQTNPVARAEEIRDACVAGRRIICGRIVEVRPNGFVIECGYTNLLGSPLYRSWLLPATITAERDPNLVEGREPDSICAGRIFLVDTPKSRFAKPKLYDYIHIRGYPAGTMTYSSMGVLQTTLRRFSAGLETAIKLNLEAEAKPYGFSARPKSGAYLLMPKGADGPFPPLLSQTGAFADAAHLVPSDALIPYDLNVSFWADGAQKSRWVSIPPEERIKFAPTGEWAFPNGTVFVKHFELATDETHPEIKRRLETRLLVRDAKGGVYGVTYKWRPDNSDADLLETNFTEPIAVKTTAGVQAREWYYPSRQDCLACHTANAGGVLGVKARQLNRDFAYPSGVKDNELRTWNHLGLFDRNLDRVELSSCPSLARTDELSRSIEDRARSYLDANCAQCHRPQGTVAYFDARYDTPLPKQGLIEGQILLDEGIDGARMIAPNDIWRSILYLRTSTLEAMKMPPLAHNALDVRGMALLREWIESLPGPPVLEPPTVSPPGGNFSKPVEVTLQSAPGAAIHYTLDGTKPTVSDPLYDKPLNLSEPTVVRARAFRKGFTKSIPSQEIYIIAGQ
jgi:uncharacterized repeat protein (TIGR03806 family)